MVEKVKNLEGFFPDVRLNELVSRRYRIFLVFLSLWFLYWPALFIGSIFFEVTIWGYLFGLWFCFFLFVLNFLPSKMKIVCPNCREKMNRRVLEYGNPKVDEVIFLCLQCRLFVKSGITIGD